MAGQFRENWKRMANKLPPLNMGPTAFEDKDLVRVEDLAILAGGSGLYRVTNLTSPGPTLAPGWYFDFKFLIIIPS